ncbi:MAG: MliC family protein [Thermodesulfobacteriota bacterium]
MTACYGCEGLGPITVQYFPGDGASILVNGKAYRLERAISASGARYEGENIMIWDKGGTARLVLDGGEYSCRVSACP